jgi:hypothetical protein
VCQILKAKFSNYSYIIIVAQKCNHFVDFSLEAWKAESILVSQRKKYIREREREGGRQGRKKRHGGGTNRTYLTGNTSQVPKSEKIAFAFEIFWVTVPCDDCGLF